MSFENKVVIITGASSGIGEATAIGFAKNGANLVLVGRNLQRLKKVGDECERFGKKPLLVIADVSKDEDTKNVIKQTINTFGKIDVLINNAGFLAFSKILSDDLMDVYDKIMNTNLRGTVQMTTLAAPYLVKTKGNIINISSIAALSILAPEYVAYSVSKAGMDHFTRHVANELAPYGVRVNSINPGPVRTAIFNVSGSPHNPETLGDLTALKKPSDSEEVAELILFVVSGKGRSLTGSSYVIDNGYLLK